MQHGIYPCGSTIHPGDVGSSVIPAPFFLFLRNKFNGFGQISLNNGDFIRGEFKDGKLHGEGNVNFNDSNSNIISNFVFESSFSKSIHNI